MRIDCLTRTIRLCAIIFLVGGCLLSGPAVVADPDFSEVNDLLEGDRHLLRNDDLAYFGINCSSFPDHTECLTDPRMFLTSQSNVVTEPFALRNFPWTRLDRWRTAFINNAEQDPQAWRALRAGVAAGRLFNLPNDVFAGVARGDSNGPNGAATLTAMVLDPGLAKANNYKNPENFTIVDNMAPYAGEVDFSATADFDYDGFDELVVHTASGHVYLATAKNVDQFKDGLKYTELAQMPVRDASRPSALAVFETQCAPNRKCKVLALVEPAATAGQLKITYQRVNPRTLQPDLPVVTNPLWLPVAQDNVASLSLAVGRYGRTDVDQLAVAYATSGGVARVAAYDITPDSNQGFPLRDSLLLTTEAGIGTVIKSGRLDGRLPFDQAVVWLGHPGRKTPNSALAVVAFDNNLHMTLKARPGLGAGCVSDFTLGRFDRRQPTQAQGQDINAQVAIVVADPLAYSGNECGASPQRELRVIIFDVDPTKNFDLRPANQGYLSPGVGDFGATYGKLVAGDFQGRAVRLGAPAKLTSNESKVQITLQSPPMHVDWTAPASGGNPRVLNLSAAPADFFTRFRTDASRTITGTSARSFGATWSIYFKGSLMLGGGGKDDFLGGTVKTSMKEKLETLNEWKTDTTWKQAFDVTAQTGFGDLIWYTDSRRNVYLYPVVGHKACTVDRPTCAPSEKGSAVVQFVADDQISPRVQSGNNLEWFQPVTEPGNVFSYPSNYAQLKALYRDIDPLTATAPVAFSTDDIAVEQNFRWDQGQGAEQKVSTGDSFSGDWSLGMKGKTFSFGVVAEGEFDVGFAYDGASKAANTNTTTLSNAFGIGIKKPGLFADPNLYRYDVQPYVLGRKRDKDWPDFGAPTGDIRTQGPLQVAYSVDLSRGGAWWHSDAYAVPDVALNHPSRWRIVDRGDDSACLGKSCAVFNNADPSNVWLSQFHWMRGFYVTPAATNDQSLQLAQLTKGEPVRLSARVYNYSTANMLAGSRVHVRFYGQEWNIGTNRPAGGKDSFLIEEKTYDPIPGFQQSPSNAFNWILAQTEFDPSIYVNKDLAFWVLVWMEDGRGRLAAEVADHGLTRRPGDLSTIDGVPIEAHSNNVGLYKHAFHVFPDRSAPQAGKPGPDVTRVVAFRVKPLATLMPRYTTLEDGCTLLEVNKGDTVTVELVLKNRNVPVSSPTPVNFYDYNPDRIGKRRLDRPFDVDTVAYMPADRAVRIAVPYTARRCGARTLWVTAPSRKVTAKAQFHVACR